MIASGLKSISNGFFFLQDDSGVLSSRVLSKVQQHSYQYSEQPCCFIGLLKSVCTGYENYFPIQVIIVYVFLIFALLNQFGIALCECKCLTESIVSEMGSKPVFARLGLNNCLMSLAQVPLGAHISARNCKMTRIFLPSWQPQWSL